MRTLFTVGREISYQRNQFLLRLMMRFADVTVVDSPPRSFVQNSILKRSIISFLKAAPMLKQKNYDLIFVGFFGHLLMLWLHPFIKSSILYDVFLSTYDTLCFDRKKYRPDSIPGKLAFMLDKKTCSYANSVLLDTPQHIDYFVNQFDLPKNIFHCLPVGCNEDLFNPLKSKNNMGSSIIRVLLYSSYLPLHGMDVIIDAANILSSYTNVVFRLIGNGPLYNQIRSKTDNYKLKNIEFAPQVPVSRLPEEIAQADICLGGHFGVSDKARRVIPGKIYQILAMGKPLIAGDTPANRSLLTDGKNCLFSPPADPDELAKKILVMSKDVRLRNHLGANARSLYLERCSEDVVAPQLEIIINNTINKE